MFSTKIVRKSVMIQMHTKIMKIGEKNDLNCPTTPTCRLARGRGVGATASRETEQGVGSELFHALPPVATVAKETVGRRLPRPLFILAFTVTVHLSSDSLVTGLVPRPLLGRRLVLG